jgi:hypothetical protein
MTDNDGRRRLIIEVEGTATRPTGWVSDERSRTPFDGWLQLFLALDQAITGQPARPEAWKRLG